jgi:hypothetical protein
MTDFALLVVVRPGVWLRPTIQGQPPEVVAKLSRFSRKRTLVLCVVVAIAVLLTAAAVWLPRNSQPGIAPTRQANGRTTTATAATLSADAKPLAASGLPAVLPDKGSQGQPRLIFAQMSTGTLHAYAVPEAGSLDQPLVELAASPKIGAVSKVVRWGKYVLAMGTDFASVVAVDQDTLAMRAVFQLPRPEPANPGKEEDVAPWSLTVAGDDAFATMTAGVRTAVTKISLLSGDVSTKVLPLRSTFPDVCASDGHLYVSGDYQIAKLEAASLTIEAEFDMPPSAVPSAITCGENVVIAPSSLNRFYRIEGEAVVPAGTWPGRGAYGLVRYAGGRIAATDSRGLVIFCDARAENCVSRPLDGQPQDIAAMGSTIAVLTWSTPTVAVFNGDTDDLMERQSALRYPRGLWVG